MLQYSNRTVDAQLDPTAQIKELRHLKIFRMHIIHFTLAMYGVSSITSALLSSC